ncbi:MAG TPA: hypothetical protein VI997_00775 [Candidatus Thermoplasmatota archaeon]|nr:hypothetical protein [Candidatus Thermoplasmatota archaeon]
MHTLPGKERDVMDRLGRLPQVTGRHHLFPGALALKVECPRDAMDFTVDQLGRLDGVVTASTYQARNT